MERNVEHLLLRKADVLKTSIFSERKFEECTNLEEQKDTRYIQGNVYIDIIVFSCRSSAKSCLRFYLKFFCSGDKRLLS